MKKVFLENLPRFSNGKNKNRINWRKSVNMEVNFIYNEIEGKIKIIDYEKNYLTVLYNNNMTNIFTNHFANANLGGVLNIRTKNFKIKIGQIFKDDRRNMIIINREYRNDLKRNNWKYYQYHCNICGYTGFMEETSLLKQKSRCLCCSGKVIKEGVNDIPTVAPWMTYFFQGGVNEAKLYSIGSHKKIYPICPDCGRVKDEKIMISNIYRNHSIGCNCSDRKSYPEKFTMELLNQLNIDYKTEYSPNWIKPKRYDFYIPNLKCIIETHGLQHYNGNFKHLGGRSLQEEIENDGYKKETALKNGIKHYIELDCRKSELEWIKNSIINSELNKLFNLSNIDWLRCAEFANKNIVKEVCDYWNDKRESETTADLSKMFKINKSTIIDYLRRGTKLGWCNYNGRKNNNKGLIYGRIIKRKKVEIFKDNKSLGEFESLIELERQSEKLFGVKLNNSKISMVCNGKKKQYKGYTFKHVDHQL